LSSRVAAVDRTVAAEQVDSELARDSLLPLVLLTPLLLAVAVRLEEQVFRLVMLAQGITQYLALSHLLVGAAVGAMHHKPVETAVLAEEAASAKVVLAAQAVVEIRRAYLRPKVTMVEPLVKECRAPTTTKAVAAVAGLPLLAVITADMLGATGAMGRLLVFLALALRMPVAVAVPVVMAVPVAQVVRAAAVTAIPVR
jgi:hypothetical protein